MPSLFSRLEWADEEVCLACMWHRRGPFCPVSFGVGDGIDALYPMAWLCRQHVWAHCAAIM